MYDSNQNQTLKLFLEQAYAKELTDTEVDEYKYKFVKFVSILVEIDQKSKKGGKAA